MLNSYTNGYRSIMAFTAGAVQYVSTRNNSHFERQRQWKQYPNEQQFPTFYGYKHRRLNDKPSNLKARLRSAAFALRGIATVCKSEDERYKHWSIGIAEQIRRSARKLMIDTDNPNTHIKFIPHNAPDNRKCRYRSMTFARFIRRQCAHIVKRYELTDAMIERMDINYQLEPKIPPVKLLTGADASKIYMDGDIDSCMAGMDYNNHLFHANPDKYFLAVAYFGDSLLFRAKVYKMDNDAIYLERVYYGSTADSFSERMIEEVIKSELCRRFGVTSIVDRGSVYKITLNHRVGESMPYMDYVHRYDRIDDNTVCFRQYGRFHAGNCDGTDDSAGHICESCGATLTDDTERTDNDGTVRCQDCHDECYAWDDISGNEIDRDDSVELMDGRITHTDNATELSTDFYPCNTYVLCDKATEDYDGRYIRIDDSHYTHDGDTFHNEDQSIVILHNGEYAHESESVELADGGYALKSEACELSDGWYLQDDCESFIVVDDYGNEIECWVVIDVAELLEGLV